MADKGILSGLIMEGTRFEGKLTFDDKMRIDGEFIGEMSSESQLIVGKSAKINADIKVKDIVVMGEVKGAISQCQVLQIQEGGRVLADIQVKALDIKPGAVFDGKCTMVTEAEKDNSKSGRK